MTDTTDKAAPAVSPFFIPSESYRPFRKAWCVDAWIDHERMHWLPDEVDLGNDVKDWKTNMSPGEINLCTHILRYFTQQDVEVSGGYAMYLPHIKNFEARMLMIGYLSREMIHVKAYSHLIDTIGLPEVTYSAFLEYDQMRAMHDYLDSFDPNDKQSLLLSMAVFAGFAEGMALFGSFAILFNFTRFNKMKGMGQIVNWSIRDETYHTINMSRMFREIRDESAAELDIPKLAADVRRVCEEMVSHEDAFIDLAFELGPVEGLTPDMVKKYIRYVADQRMVCLGYEPVYKVETNPLPWMDNIMGVEFANFFESDPTEYTRGGTVGEWDDAFE